MILKHLLKQMVLEHCFVSASQVRTFRRPTPTCEENSPFSISTRLRDELRRRLGTALLIQRQTPTCFPVGDAQLPTRRTACEGNVRRESTLPVADRRRFFRIAAHCVTKRGVKSRERNIAGVELSSTASFPAVLMRRTLSFSLWEILLEDSVYSVFFCVL